MSSTYAAFLAPNQVLQVHEASLHILENVGMLVRNPRARDRFEQHECLVDRTTSRVRFPRQVIERYRQYFPPSFTFHGRSAQYDRSIPHHRPLIITASSATDIVDPARGEVRRSTSVDIARIAHLIQELPGYDVFSISTLADDAPAEQFTISRLFPALQHCLKPIRSTNTTVADAEACLKLAVMIAGGEPQYRQRPFITHHFCPVISPLTMDCDSTELLMYFVEQKLPVYGSIVPNAGLTSPMTLAGTLVQGNAEFLAAAVLMQIIRPGTPLIYSTLPTVGDLRSGAYASGGIECGMLLASFAQMAHFYNVPNGGYIGLTNSKINDAQSGWETGLSTMAGLLSGVDMFNLGGLLDALSSFDYAKAVIDGEIALMLKRTIQGLDFNEENLALEVIANVGPGGSFIAHDHTLAHMRKAALAPKIADRMPRAIWEEQGSLDAQQRALAQARAILNLPSVGGISSELDSQVRQQFPGMVSGKLITPEWPLEARS